MLESKDSFISTQLTWKVSFRFIIAVVLISCPTLAKDLNVATVHVSNRGYLDIDGQQQGSSYEIVNAIVEDAGFTHTNHLIPFGRIVRYLETAEVDVALLVPNDTVNQVAIPLVHIQDVDFILVGKRDVNLTQINDVKGKHVGYLRLSPTAEKVMEQLDVQKIDGGKYTHMVEMLMRDRIDVLFGPKSNVFWALKELGYGPSDLGEPLSVYKQEMHLVVSRKSADDNTISALVAAANKLKKNNVVQGIIDKYDYSITKQTTKKVSK